MMKYFMPTAVMLCSAALGASLFSIPALAQMPLVLQDVQQSVDPAIWRTVSEDFQGVLECRKRPDRDQDKAFASFLATQKGDLWVFVPSNDFRVFGLSVQAVTIDRGLGAGSGDRFTASLTAPVPMVKDAAGLDEDLRRSATIGVLTAKQGAKPSLTDLTCMAAD